MKDFIRKNKQVFWFLGFLFLQIAYFLIQLMIKEHNPIRSPIDDKIPFIPAFVLPYIYWYVYVPAPMIVMCLKDKNVFKRQVSGLFTGFLICLAVFLIYPSCVEFRPENPGGGLFGWICGIIYKNDNPWNVFPSLHCFEAWIIHMTTFWGTKYRSRVWLRAVSAVSAVLISASTVFIKQHSIIDVAAGCILAAAIYIVVDFAFRRKRNDNKTV